VREAASFLEPRSGELRWWRCEAVVPEVVGSLGGVDDEELDVGGDDED